MTTPSSGFIAQHRIGAPGTLVTAYQAGDPVTDQVVESWGLVVPDDVVPADGYQAPRPAEDSDARTAWEAYVIGQGTTVEDARAASLDDLRGMYPAPKVDPPAHDLPASVAPEGVAGTGATPVQPIPPATPPVDVDRPTAERPATSARKADWVDYVIAAGGDQAWATDDTTTKDDLMGWEPGRNG